MMSTVVSSVSWAQPSDLSFGKIITTACVTERRASAGRRGTVEAYFHNLDLAWLSPSTYPSLSSISTALVGPVLAVPPSFSMT